MKLATTPARIQPEVRRTASRTSSTSATPKKRSQRVGVTARSMKSSKSISRWPMVASPNSDSATSNQRMRLRSRFAAGKSRKSRNSTNPRCVARSTCAGTMAKAA